MQVVLGYTLSEPVPAQSHNAGNIEPSALVSAIHTLFFLLWQLVHKLFYALRKGATKESLCHGLRGFRRA
jgi:hypothetical protein